jgi:hypothetical protein
MLAILAMGAFSACQPGASVAPAGALAGVPAPADAVVDLGGGSVAIDGDRQFVAYRSNATPATATKRFDRQLEAAGYRSVGRRTGWNCYLRGDGRGNGDVVLVYVEPDGPPTTILVAAGTPADLTTADGRTGDAPETPGVGTPDPTSAIKTHKPTGQGSGGGNGNGAGNGGGQGSGAGGGQGSGAGGGSGNGGGNKDKPRPTPTPRPTPPPKAHDANTSAPSR